jgi:uncharacterized protein
VSVELRPLGVTCNIACQYCYQNPQRDAGNFGKRYDLEAMKAAILEEGGSFTLFGGEPLLLPEKDLENLWAWGMEKFGSNHLQTNGTLINEDHIRMFREYKVHVGISIDGPGELNDVRWNGDLQATREATAKIERTIERLCREKLTPSLIVTLHRNNATEDKLPRMHEWFRRLERIGIRFARLHILEVEDEAIRSKYALSAVENVRALLSFAGLEKELGGLKLDVFSDMENLLLLKDKGVTCVWAGCDPYSTAAVRGVEGHGQRSNCGRTNKEGIDFVKAETPGFERYLALYKTPQEHNGCRDCRFFLACKGQCPGTAVDGDWRNRTEHCEVWMALFEQVEERLMARGQTPISLSPQRELLERMMVVAWSAGTSPSIEELLKEKDEPATANISAA